MKVPGWSARELEVISGLRELGAATAPDEPARQRIRSGILAGLAEPGNRTPSRRRRRLLAGALTATVALVIVLGGAGLLLARHALPGDPLYGVKLAGESAELELSFGDAAKARKHLEFATNRLDELAALGGTDPAPYQAALADFQREARTGTAQFIELAVQGGGQDLDLLRAWAQAQNRRLAAVAGTIPAQALGHLTSSAELVARIDARARTLLTRLDCFEITSGETDDLGPVPHSGPCRLASRAARGSTPPLPPPASPGPAIPRAAPLTSPSTPESTPAAVSKTSDLPPSDAVAAPTVFPPPITAPASPRSTLATSPPPSPVISVPPLPPGLPALGIG